MAGPRPSPLCVALDGADGDDAERLAAATEPYAGAYKVGSTLFVSAGGAIVRRLGARRPVFLDLKLHDIPAQVAGAVGAAAGLGATYLTVHASGGRAMLAAAADAAAGALTLLGVTVLTSLGDDDLAALGVAGTSRDHVLRLAEVALSAGLPGLVCSPLEVGAIRTRFGARADGGPVVVVPGIRAAGGPADDQRRTLGAADAVAAGADLVVVGRPIAAAPDAAAAARRIFEAVTA